nr:PREDICTED: endonuclease domain-containing 1 protein-like [Lepisosteus oculatus]
MEPNRPACICQVYGKFARFATLYDRKNRIPVYSAFIFTPGPLPCLFSRREEWFIEPQLTYSNRPPEMMLMEHLYNSEHKPRPNSDLCQLITDSQATDCDYAASGFDKGHLNLNCFQFAEGRDATFTLTNAVPMYENFNRVVWSKAYENVMMSAYKASRLFNVLFP